MKKYGLAVVSILMGLISLHSGCGTESQDSSYEKLLDYINDIKVIDTHEHQVLNSAEHDRMDKVFTDQRVNFYSIYSTSYLQSDLVSVGSPGPMRELIASGNLDSLWAVYGSYMDQCRNTSYYNHFLLGFKQLYGLTEDSFTAENIALLSEQIGKNYQDLESWYDRALEIGGIDLMLNDQYWHQFKIYTDHPRHALVMRIDMYIVAVADREGMESGEADTLSNPFWQARRDGVQINTLNDYLDFAGRWFERFAEAGAVCAKSAIAYYRTLEFDQVDLDEAKELFARPSSSLSDEDRMRLQNFVFHWCVDKCAEVGLPLQVHTGYLAGNRADIDNGRPTKLLNVLQAHPETEFVLFHGGYPWHQEIGAIAKSYPNVHLDLCWLPQMSRQAAYDALSEWLDSTPYTKFFWGGDTHTIEETAGALVLGRELVARVLADKVDRGLMSEEFAREVALGIFRNNAIEFFDLENDLANRAE